MTHPEEVKRLFTETDEEALQQSDVQFDSFLANKSQFVERFPDLDDPFAAEWTAATTTARALPPDYVSVNEQAKETTLLENLMEQGRNLFQSVMLYTQLAFPDDRAVLRLFGQPQYDAARTSQLKLPVLLRSTYTQVSKPEYKTALMAKGLKDTDITLLDSLAGAITAQDLIQQNAKKARLLATSQRIVAMNAVWEKMALVCQCAKLVFQDDAAKYNLFLLTDSEVPAKEEAPAPVAPN